jgi:hypothetical protein
LVVDELLSNKGALITSCANCVAEVVVDNGTYFDVYFSAVDRDGNAVSNPWLATDQALCLTFNGMGAGTFTDVKNRYYWRVVTRVDSNVTYNGKIYHHIRLSNTSGMYDGSTIPAAGDNLVQLGYRGNVSGNEYRQSATILSSYPTMDAEVTPPSLAFYKGINDFSLSSHRYTFIDGLSNEFIGNFKILVNGSYNNLTTVLATIEGLVTTVTKTVRGKNLIPSEGWSYDDGDLLPVERFDPGDQFLDNGNEDVLYSPVVYLPAGTYVFSLYSSTSSLELYIYSSAQNKPAAASMLVAQNLFISNVLSGDTYQSLPRRYVSFTLQDDAYVVLNVYEDSTQFTAYHPQLESGSTPTAWEIGTVVKSSQVKQTADMYNINIRTALGQTGVNINGSTREINLIAGKVNFKNSAGSADSGKIQIDAANGRLITHDAILRGNLFLPYTRITQSNWSDYGTYNSNVGTTYNLLGEVTGKTAAGLNLQIEYIKTVSGTTNLAHVRLPDLTGKDPDSWVGCEVNILNATTTEPLYVRGTLNGDNFGLAKWSNDGWNVSDHNVGINPGCEGKFKLIKTGSGIYKWICCYINLNQ